MAEFGHLGLLQFSLLTTSLLLVVIFLIAWLSFGRKNYALIWCLTFFVAALEWLLNLYAASIPLSSEYIGFLASLLTIITVSLAFLGHRQRLGLTTRLSFLVIAGSSIWAGVVWYELYGQTSGVRSSLVPFYSFIILGWTAIIVVLKSPVRTPAVWGTGFSMLLLGLTLVVYGWLMFLGGSGLQTNYDHVASVLLMTALPSSFVAMGVFSVLLLAADMAEELKAHSIMDMLTSTLNRRGIEEAIRPAFAQARRYSQPLAVVITDIDLFKTINDDYGHVTGDNALSMFARTLKDQLRAEDIIGRMGGEEFIIVLPNTDLENAGILIERLRHVVASTLISTNEYKFNMTASFGLTLVKDDDGSMEDAIHRADAALYRAKDLGRNRVEVI